MEKVGSVLPNSNSEDKKARLCHNTFFQAVVVMQTRILIAMLKVCLPKGIAKWIDFESLELINDSKINKPMSMLYSDVAIKLKLKDLYSHITICIIIEHKAQIHKNDIIQLFHYVISEIRKNSLENSKEPLRMVIPLLMSQAERPRGEKIHIKDL